MNLITFNFEPRISALTAYKLLSDHGYSFVEFLRDNSPEDVFNQWTVLGYLGYKYK